MGLCPSPFAEKIKNPNQRGIFTVELSPPKGVDVSKVVADAKTLVGKVDAINVPDCQRSILKMSAMATSKLIQEATGIETVWQLSCRDRNIIALQADLMGAYALGLTNVLALTGDPVQVGDQVEVAKQVFHLESVRLLHLIQQMNQGVDATGKPLKDSAPQFCVGAAINPLRIYNHAQVNRLKQKLEEGVDFFQTQPVYQLEWVERMMAVVHEAADVVGCPRPKVLVGIIPPKSAKSARFMNKHVAGIDIPESFIEQLERSEDPPKDSMMFCSDLMHQMAPLADGFHIMPVGMQSRVGELLDMTTEIVSAGAK